MAQRSAHNKKKSENSATRMVLVHSDNWCKACWDVTKPTGTSYRLKGGGLQQAARAVSYSILSVVSMILYITDKRIPLVRLAGKSPFSSCNYDPCSGSTMPRIRAWVVATRSKCSMLRQDWPSDLYRNARTQICKRASSADRFCQDGGHTANPASNRTRGYSLHTASIFIVCSVIQHSCR
eukprot:scaffold187112_cov19-Prasinocladus_malaysianus.AAC.3